MTPQQLFGTAIRIFAIWLVITSFPLLVTVPDGLAASPDAEGARNLSRMIGGIYLLAAALLWFFPMLVAHKIIPRTKETNTLVLPGYELARVASGLLGLWLFARALPNLFWFLFRAFLNASAGVSFSPLTPEFKLELAVNVFEIVLGMAFITKSPQFARLLVGEPRQQP